jgi:hypothetical protein
VIDIMQQLQRDASPEEGCLKDNDESKETTLLFPATHIPLDAAQ